MYMYMYHMFVYIYIYIYIYICSNDAEKTTYLNEKYFQFTSLSIHFIYICLKTVT